MSTREFASYIISIGMAYKVSVTSWGRTIAHNHAVGGVADSLHLDWLAVDLVLDAGADKQDVIGFATKLGLQAFWDVDHIHIQAPRVKP